MKFVFKKDAKSALVSRKRTSEIIEWSLKNYGSLQIFRESLHLGISNWSLRISSAYNTKQVSESCILEFESWSLASQAKV